MGRACPHHARPSSFGFKVLSARGFAARRLRRSFSVYQASQADNRSFLTIDLDAYGLRCPPPSASRKQSRTRLALARSQPAKAGAE